jgi:hypothetical protein
VGVFVQQIREAIISGSLAGSSHMDFRQALTTLTIFFFLDHLQNKRIGIELEERMHIKKIDYATHAFFAVLQF